MGIPIDVTLTGIGYLDLTPTIYPDVGKGEERINY
jgi:hypothetical protein